MLQVVKRKPTAREWRQLRQIVTRLEPRVLRGFLRFVNAIRADLSPATLLAAIENESAAPLFRSADFDRLAEAAVRETISAPLREAFQATGEVSARMLPGGAVFEIENTRGIEFLQRQGAALVTNVTDSTRAAIRAASIAAREQGFTAQQTAQLIRPSIGLLDTHAVAVVNRAAKLTEAGFSAAEVAAEAASYAGRLTQYRAMMIARTEPRIAAIAGQREAWEQAIDRGTFARAELRRTWIAVEDNPDPDDPCPRLDGQTVGMDEPFVDPETGDEFDSPPDPHPHCVCALEADF